MNIYLAVEASYDGDCVEGCFDSLDGAIACCLKEKLDCIQEWEVNGKHLANYWKASRKRWERSPIS